MAFLNKAGEPVYSARELLEPASMLVDEVATNAENIDMALYRLDTGLTEDGAIIIRIPPGIDSDSYEAKAFEPAFIEFAKSEPKE